MSAEWIATALGSSSVSSVSVTQIAAGEGFIGLLARVRVAYTAPGAGADAPSSVIVKLPNPDPGAQVIGTMLRMWEREGRFYDELAGAVTVRIPACYCVAVDPSDGRVALVLEDLSALSAEDQLTGTSLVRAEAAVDWLAGYHAVGWGAADDPSYLSWLPRPDDPIFAGLHPMAVANADAFGARFSSSLTAGRRSLLATSIADVPSLLADQSRPYTVCHGDFRLANMLFDDDGSLVVLDWQLILAGSFAYDLTYFLVLSLTVEQRRSWERALLSRYVEVLRSAGVVDVPSMDAVWDGYRRTIHFIVGVLPVTTVTLDFDVNPRARAFAFETVERAFAAAEDHPL